MQQQYTDILSRVYIFAILSIKSKIAKYLYSQKLAALRVCVSKLTFSKHL